MSSGIDSAYGVRAFRATINWPLNAPRLAAQWSKHPVLPCFRQLLQSKLQCRAVHLHNAPAAVVINMLWLKVPIGSNRIPRTDPFRPETKCVGARSRRYDMHHPITGGRHKYRDSENPPKPSEAATKCSLERLGKEIRTRRKAVHFHG